MTGLEFTVEVQHNRIPDILRKLPREIDRQVEHVAHMGVELAQSIVRVDTGALRASITSRRITDGYTIGSDLDYAAPQEYGTRHMTGRPYLRPAAEYMAQQFDRLELDLLS